LRYSMVHQRLIVVSVCVGVLTLCASWVTAAEPAAPADKGEAAVRQASARLAEAFNAGDAAKVAALFVADGELTDDAGNVHKGQEEIKALLTQFFTKYPGAQIKAEIDSVKIMGASVAIVEGVQTISTKDGQASSAIPYTSVLVNRGGSWSFATCEQYPEESPITPHEQLLRLEWMIGSWVSEASDSTVAFSVRWSEDGNFLLADYESKIAGQAAIKSSQRIGWDPVNLRYRSWMFDSDGGYGEAAWTPVDNSWLLKSTVVMPDGTTGSATVVFEPLDEGKYLMRGLDRVLGDEVRPDFEVTIVRKPPEAAK